VSRGVTQAPRLRIAFLCKPTPAAGLWTPRSVDTGIGGSEEACINVAELLGQRGHRVSVNMPGVGSGQRFGSVTYDDVDALKGEPVDVAVMWVHPHLADTPEASTFQAGRKYLWLHNVFPDGRVLEFLHHYDKVIVPSAYLQRRLHDVPDDQIVVITNGIDAGHFNHSHYDREPHLIVYGNDYIWGLETLLRCWPTIRKRVPDCRLNVFYGWDGIDGRALRGDPPNPKSLEIAKLMHRKLDPLLLQPGVSHLGRIGHLAVAEQFMRAGVWGYPTWATETCCISGLKAQAGGAVPAVIPTGALKETVRFGFRTGRGYDDLPETSGGVDDTRHDWPISAADERELVNEWLTGLIDLLESPAEQARIREKMIPATKADYAWTAVVDLWEREFADTAT
jgi:glycosyltransferase involved in cell wall biosynthesis